MNSEKRKEKIEQIYSYIKNYVQNNGYSPSVREICLNCHVRSTATAHSYLEKLKIDGRLDKTPMKNRSLSLTELSTPVNVPVLGEIAAGTPIFATENLEGYCPLPSEFNKNSDCFALRVRGESMINAGIYNNDLIIVEKSNYAKNGDIVVALIDDSATVKRLIYYDGKVILRPENDAMDDMIFDNLSIIGIVKRLIRKF